MNLDRLDRRGFFRLSAGGAVAGAALLSEACSLPAPRIDATPTASPTTVLPSRPKLAPIALTPEPSLKSLPQVAKTELPGYDRLPPKMQRLTLPSKEQASYLSRLDLFRMEVGQLFDPQFLGTDPNNIEYLVIGGRYINGERVDLIADYRVSDNGTIDNWDLRPKDNADTIDSAAGLSITNVYQEDGSLKEGHALMWVNLDRDFVSRQFITKNSSGQLELPANRLAQNLRDQAILRAGLLDGALEQLVVFKMP